MWQLLGPTSNLPDKRNRVGGGGGVEMRANDELQIKKNDPFVAKGTRGITLTAVLGSKAEHRW